MKIGWSLFLLTFTACSIFADSAPDAKTQLRKLATLPSASVTFGFSFNPASGITFQCGEDGTEEAIAKIKKEMRHDSSDAERYLELGRLLDKRPNSTEEAKAAHEQSVKLFRQQVESHPEDGPLLAKFGEALSYVDADEAQRVLRKATQVAPKDWHCWAALGDVLLGASFGALYRDQNENLAPLDWVKRILAVKPTPERLEAAQKLKTESLGCFDKAVALIPNEPSVYINRGATQCSANLLQMLFDLAQNKQIDQRQISMVYFTGAGEDDFRMAAKLNPTNCQALGVVIFFEAVHELLQHPGAFALSELWGHFSVKSEKAIRESMSGLTSVGENPDKHLAAAALIIKGVMQFLVMNDLTAAEGSLRQATMLDPSQSQAWDLLDSVLAEEEHYDDLLAVCEARVKNQTTPHTLFMQAKAEEYLKHYDKAESLLGKILELAPDDIDANLGLAALLLKHVGEHAMFHASNQLERAKAALAKLPDNDDTTAKKVHLIFHYGIYCALEDQPDQARKMFQQVLDHDKDDKDAQAAMKIIGNLQ